MVILDEDNSRWKSSKEKRRKEEREELLFKVLHIRILVSVVTRLFLLRARSEFAVITVTKHDGDGPQVHRRPACPTTVLMLAEIYYLR